MASQIISLFVSPWVFVFLSSLINLVYPVNPVKKIIVTNGASAHTLFSQNKANLQSFEDEVSPYINVTNKNSRRQETEKNKANSKPNKANPYKSARTLVLRLTARVCVNPIRRHTLPRCWLTKNKNLRQSALILSSRTLIRGCVKKKLKKRNEPNLVIPARACPDVIGEPGRTQNRKIGFR
jgi:hypothetical protein